MSLFSVIIPTYNRAAFLPKALDSVLAQEFRDFELIVVDDGSTDATEEVLKTYQKRVRIFRQENQGPGAARNLGVKNSNSQYVAFLDSDDYWFPWTLATYDRVIQIHNRPNIVCGALWYFDDERKITSIQRQSLASDFYDDFYTAGRKGLYCGSGQMAVRRESLVAIGGFAEGKINAEDHDLVMRLGTMPGFVNVTAPAMIAYRQHAEASTKDLSKTFNGSMRLVEMENAGHYPGGSNRRQDRRRILSNHVRPLTIELLRHREYQKAWALYRRTFSWNVGLGRFRYLVGFSVQAALSWR